MEESTTSCITGFKSFTLNSNYIGNNGYSYSNSRLQDRNGNVVKSVIIRPNLRVGDYIVRTDNSDDTVGKEGGGISAGTVKWDKSTKTLTFTGVTQTSYNGKCGITNYGIDGLTVAFSGSNSITVPANHNIYSKNSITLKGLSPVSSNSSATDGVTLTNNSSAACAVFVQGAKLTIEMVCK